MFVLVGSDNGDEKAEKKMPEGCLKPGFGQRETTGSQRKAKRFNRHRRVYVGMCTK